LSLINDIESVEAFVKSVHAASTTYKQTVPRTQTANMFVIRFQGDSRELETAAHYRIDREYQIVYFGADETDVLAKMDALSKALYQRKLIGIKDSLRYIRVESFSFSQPFKTENALYACIGVLSTEVREARDQATYTKIMQVNARFE
jgi:hypothetical protein